MKICNKKEGYRHPELIRGHIYRLTQCHGEPEDEYYIAGKSKPEATVLISLADGNRWSSPKTPFGEDHNNHKWQDVTDKVCLDVSGVES